MKAQNTNLHSPDNFHHTRGNRSTGDLRNEHEFTEDNSTLGGSFVGLCSIDRACAGPTARVVLKATGVLPKTSQAKRRHEAEVLLQAEERHRHAERSDQPAGIRCARKKTLKSASTT